MQKNAGVYTPFVDLENMLRQPLAEILEIINPSPAVMAELRDAMVAAASSHLHYVWFGLRYAPVLASWCQMADNYDQWGGRSRSPGDFDAQPVTRAIVQLFRYQYLGSVLDELPTGSPEWDALSGILERIHRRQIGTW